MESLERLFQFIIFSYYSTILHTISKTLKDIYMLNAVSIVQYSFANKNTKWALNNCFAILFFVKQMVTKNQRESFLLQLTQSFFFNIATLKRKKQL